MILAIANALFGEADRNGYLIELYTCKNAIFKDEALLLYILNDVIKDLLYTVEAKVLYMYVVRVICPWILTAPNLVIIQFTCIF